MKGRRLSKFIPYLIGPCLLMTLGACGDFDDDDDDDNSPQQQQPTPQAAQEDIGRYRVNLAPVNTLGGLPEDDNAVGLADINIEGDEMTVLLGGNNIRRKESGQRMHIHTLGTCPTVANDGNGDRIIDIVEGSAAFGLDLIPLDGDLNSQDAGATDLERANQFGLLGYNETAVVSRMLADLRIPDPNPNDLMAKLSPEENLNLAGRALVIHGVPDDMALPATVASPGEAAVHTVPISCGVIERVSEGGTTGGTAGVTGGTATGGSAGGTVTGGTAGGTVTGGTAGGTVGGTAGGTATGGTAGGTASAGTI
ncbi:MAG TPA: hypothetical protein VNJ08_16660 [Bacteriovoracaceae bacterium]|nr:hypothetical protein [Bacteriovoracaceae bacterium]